MIRKIKKFLSLPPSRKNQVLLFALDRLITAIFYRWRLKQCGTGTIVQPLLFWTPEFVTLGNDVLIWKGCRIEGIHSYGNAYFKPDIYIGNRVSFQQGCHLTAASTLSIGDDTTVLFNVLITDIDHLYEEIGINVANQRLKISETHIGKNCFIGAGARIQAGTRLGTQCIVGANAVVRGSFPDYCVLVGAPARIVKRFDPATACWRKTNSKGEFIND